MNFTPRPAPDAHYQAADEGCTAQHSLDAGQGQFAAAGTRQDHRRQDGKIGERGKEVDAHVGDEQPHQSAPCGDEA